MFAKRTYDDRTALVLSGVLIFGGGSFLLLPFLIIPLRESASAFDADFWAASSVLWMIAVPMVAWGLWSRFVIGPQQFSIDSDEVTIVRGKARWTGRLGDVERLVWFASLRTRGSHTVHQESVGGLAVVTPLSASQSSTLGTPSWWSSLPPAPKGSTNAFVRGHLIAGTFGGAGGDSFYNLVPLYRRANNPGMEQCEIRIKKLAEECGYCVTMQVTADYSQSVSGLPSNVQPIVPYKIKIDWVADGAEHSCG